MKKIITNKLFLVSIFFTSLPLYANFDNYAFYGGLNMGTITMDPPSSKEIHSRWGGLLGLNFSFPLSETIDFTPEISLVEKGAWQEVTLIKLTYLEIPLLLRFRFERNRLRIIFFSGPAIGICVDAKAQSLVSGAEVNITDLIAKNEVSAQGGILFDYRMSNVLGIFVGGKYSRGITNIVTTSSLTDRNNGIFLFAGISVRETPVELDLETRAADYIKLKSPPTLNPE